MTIQKGDFISLEFTGRITETGDVFDTNKEQDKTSVGMENKEMKPFALSVGHKMLPEGFDEDLPGKEIGANYEVTLTPEKAFGERKKEMIVMIPTKRFHEQQIEPQRGMMLTLDGQLVRILSSDRGRTLVDFNNPLAGKKVTYNYTILKKVEDSKEQINALQEFLFRQTFEFEEKEGTIVFKVPQGTEKTIEIFKPKFKEILGKEIETETPKKDSKEEKKEKNKE